ncbi:Endonuclease/exonuclease/phosphatase [Shewanella sp. MR-4]|uniref:endonuclease/exonuclease/phosphatase family protein n=1 Tax=Shewanella sp. (strain MR-4) TaxID=60480 RepID=UPI00005E5F58|nr:endonuclease/exonuclease/phosphatase family protein [Shewanella sp. MR-4]ABI40514.1 Endonuclease/exonuclease/phosphatase [Shewanella sp. MR-4]
MLLYNLRFGWWNVALSPSAPQAKSKANATTYPIICTHIETLLQDNSCDFLALCEVSSEDIRYFSENIKLEHISILNLTDKIGKTRFDLAVIYKTSKIKVNHINSLSKILTDNTVKASQLVEVENIDDSRKIYIYLCHWPSRLNGNSEEKRIAAANIVYNSASTLIESGKDVIIMGDFNDNPYDISLYKCLKASRCHDAVKKYPSEYFYNPFWRSIVSENKYSHSGITNTYRSGSYKYKQFMGEIWHSYDQIIVSGSFINNTYWHLNEFRTQVITPEVILKNYEDNSHFIDHLPIVCEITRV